MPWKKADFKGKSVWAEVDAAGNAKAEGGRQAIRYSDKEGARIYRAGASRVALKAGDVKELPAGTAADDGGGGAKGRTGSRGSGFGSAGKRTQAQSMAAQAAAHELIQSFSDDVVVCFTDGACQGNPGPAGAGAVVKLPGGEVLERYAALGEATNNVGELTAVELALELIDEADVAADVNVELLTDSKYTFGVLQQGWKAKANRELILRVRDRLKTRPVRMHWIAGHVGVAENERADALANLGVDESRSSR